MSENKLYKILNKNEINKSEIELEVELTEDAISKFKSDAIRDLGHDIQIEGFRKGHAPEKMIINKIGEMKILEKATYKALNNIIPLIITEEKLDAITQPSINVTKLAPGSEVVFKMKISLMPDVELADYKKIAKEVSPIKSQKVEDKEIDEYIDYIRRQRAEAAAMSQGKKIEKDKLELPSLDDEFVKTLGHFKDVDDFKKQLKENMLKEKEIKEQQRRRLEIVEKIINDSKIDLPKVLVDQELDRMVQKFKYDIESIKMNMVEYLKEIKKTEDDLRQEWEVDAEKRVKMNLILPKIAAKEKLKPKKEDIEKEVNHLKEHHKEIDEAHATMYVSSVLTNEEVFKFLENLK